MSGRAQTKRAWRLPLIKVGVSQGGEVNFAGSLACRGVCVSIAEAPG